MLRHAMLFGGGETCPQRRSTQTIGRQLRELAGEVAAALSPERNGVPFRKARSASARSQGRTDIQGGTDVDELFRFLMLRPADLPPPEEVKTLSPSFKP